MRDKSLWARLPAYNFPMSDGRSLAAQIVAKTVLDQDRASVAVIEHRNSCISGLRPALSSRHRR